jgi:hypothetical protein
MMASRGMGIISPKKMPKTKHRKDGDAYEYYDEGGPVGLYANIHAKRRRIAEGSGEKMRKPGAPGAPTAEAFQRSAKTAKA